MVYPYLQMRLSSMSLDMLIPKTAEYRVQKIPLFSLSSSYIH